MSSASDLRAYIRELRLSDFVSAQLSTLITAYGTQMFADGERLAGRTLGTSQQVPSIPVIITASDALTLHPLNV